VKKNYWQNVKQHMATVRGCKNQQTGVGRVGEKQPQVEFAGSFSSLFYFNKR